MRILPLERKIARILLTRQEIFRLAKEVLKHFVIILIECKSKMVASFM
jgi:hypothetical protein